MERMVRGLLGILGIIDQEKTLCGIAEWNYCCWVGADGGDGSGGGWVAVWIGDGNYNRLI